MSSNCSTCSTAKVSGVAPRPYGVSQTISNVAHVGSLACLRPVCTSVRTCTCLCMVRVYVRTGGGGGGICNVCVKLFMHCVCECVRGLRACLGLCVFQCGVRAYTSNYSTIVSHRLTPHAPTHTHTRAL